MGGVPAGMLGPKRVDCEIPHSETSRTSQRIFKTLRMTKPIVGGVPTKTLAPKGVDCEIPHFLLGCGNLEC